MELFEDLQQPTDHTHVITVITSHTNKKSLFGKKKKLKTNLILSVYQKLNLELLINRSA